jgi:hypothetical protein
VIARVDVPALFGGDGSWREIWVLLTTEADWDAFLAWIHTAFTATINYRVDGEPAELPRTIAAILEVRERASPHLEFAVDGLIIRCRFGYAPSAFDLDFDPGDMTESRLASLIVWIRAFGKLLNRPIIVCEEGLPQKPILVFLPDVDRVCVVSNTDKAEYEQ